MKVALYTKKPNRVDIHKDSDFVPATNASVDAEGNTSRNKHDNSFIPLVATHASGRKLPAANNWFILTMSSLVVYQSKEYAVY